MKISSTLILFRFSTNHECSLRLASVQKLAGRMASLINRRPLECVYARWHFRDINTWRLPARKWKKLAHSNSTGLRPNPVFPGRELVQMRRRNDPLLAPTIILSLNEVESIKTLLRIARGVRGKEGQDNKMEKILERRIICKNVN